MNDKDMGQALLRLDLSSSAQASSHQIVKIIDADRRRIRRWTRIAIALWILAAIGALAVFILGGLTFPVIAQLLADSGQGSMENPDTPFLVLAKLVAMSMVVGTASFVALVTAGLSTLLLLVNSRRATLREINSNLMQISHQLGRTQPGDPAVS